MTNRYKNKVYLMLLLLVTASVMDIFAQDSASVQVMARPLPDKILLRWAVDKPLAWKQANARGFWVERVTLYRNGEKVMSPEITKLTQQPLRPKPLQEWESLAITDQNAAVLAQALFGEEFITEVPGDRLGQIYAVNEELEQRFTFALLAAEQSYEAAELAGWAYEDNTARPEDKYAYRITVAKGADDDLLIERGSVYTGVSEYHELPVPQGVVGYFGDGHVMLSWDYGLLKDVYSHYQVERSKDSIRFEPVNRTPMFHAERSERQEDVTLFLTDSIPNGSRFYYRLIGKTPFGETGPPSQAIGGEASEQLAQAPRIVRKEIPTDNKVILEWEFEESANHLIDGFQLRRSDRDQGTYTTVQRDIPPTARRTTYERLERVNYFTIVAMGKNGSENESFPTLVQPVDSIPPSAPTGLEGVIDTLGIVRLKWNPNIEEDLGGYRIYRANDPNAEFGQITGTTVQGTEYVDTVQVRDLNKKVYYKLVAEDLRYNTSIFSELLELEQPNLVPPSPPVIKSYRVLNGEVQLEWIPSSSEDVVVHIVYRRNLAQQDGLWQNIHESSNPKEGSYTDTDIQNGKVYSYTVVAKDRAGLESGPANPIEVAYNGNTLDEDDIKFTATANRELRFISLVWKTNMKGIQEYQLYRGTGDEGLKLFKTLSGDTKSYNDTELEINSYYVYGLQTISRGGVQSALRKVKIKY